MRTIDTLLQDLRFAARHLAKSPVFAAVAIGSLAAGIGAHAAVFALIQALFLTPPPGIARPGEIVHLRDRRLDKAGPRLYDVCYPDYAYYRDHSRAFSGLASHTHQSYTDDERGEELRGRLASSNYFDVLGVAPHRGRFFRPDDDRAGGATAAVLSYALWQGRFGGDAGILGRTIRLNRQPYTVVGIAPRGFRGAWIQDSVEIWTPALREIGNPSSRLDAADDSPLQLIGRLAASRTIKDAEAELSVLARRLETEIPESRPRVGVSLSPLVGGLPGTAKGAWAYSRGMETPWLLAATVTCLLLIACANLAGALLARGLDRRKEVALRLALGAPRGRLVRQLLTESLLLALSGAAAGLAIAYALTGLLTGHYNAELEGARSFYDVRFDLSVFIYSVALAIATGGAFGLVPALRSSRPAVLPALKEDTSAFGPWRSSWRAAFLIGQVALSAMLLIGAGLMVRTLGTVLRDPGFDARNVAFLRMKPVGRKDQPYFEEVQRRLKGMKGVRSVAFIDAPPTWERTTGVSLPAERARELRVRHNRVSPGFFDALRIPVLRGRVYDPSDVDRVRRVAVVNEALAAHLWPQEGAVGQTLVADDESWEVVGVVRYRVLPREDRAAEPHLFRLGASNRMLVRVDGDLQTMIPALLAAIRPVDPAVAVTEALPLSRVLRNELASVTLVAGLLNYAAVLALVLTAIGLYGIVAMAVSRRTREIGIRMALGARAESILRVVLADGLRLAAAGIVIGMAMALAASRLLVHYLYGVPGRDPLTFALSAAMLGVVAALACLIPARRAARIDPVQALRSE